MSAPLRVTVLAGGHPYDRPSFTAALDSLDIDWHLVEHPDAQRVIADGAPGSDALLFYDMPGIQFRAGEPPVLVPPPSAVVDGFRGLTESGHPMVFCHHAIASWPAWEGFAELVGGRFHYVPGELRGRAWPDSGYRFDVTQRLTVVDTEHPVTAGLDDSFTLTDETYCYPVFADDVTPLLTTDADLSDATHWSSLRAVTGHREDRTGWSHPTGVPLAAWTRTAGRAPVVYVQPGDGPSAYANPNWRRLIANALAWVSSAASR